jgi:hypothetical protein
MLEQLRAALQGEGGGGGVGEGEEGEEGGVRELARGGLVSDTAGMRDTSTILRLRHSYSLNRALIQSLTRAEPA